MEVWTSLSTRNQTHTDKYLHFESHHPAHLNRGLVKCFHNRTGGIISSQGNLQKEVDHLARVLRQNGYPTNFICNPFARPPPPQVLDTSSPERDQEKENRPPVMIIPYDVGMSENIRHVCRTLYIRVVFKSGQSLHRKDTLPIGKFNVVYCIPCSCSLYPGLPETRRREHQDACLREKPAVVEHVWENHPPYQLGGDISAT